MTERIINLPTNKDELLYLVLSNTKSNTIIGLMRWIYSHLGNPVEQDSRQTVRLVNDQVAEWIQENWDWLIKEHTFTDNFSTCNTNGQLVVTFAYTGVSISDTWSVSSSSAYQSERSLYKFAKSK